MRRAPRHRHAGRVLERERVRHAPGLRRRHRRALRMRPVEHECGDPVPDLPVRHLRADLAHHAGAVVADDVRLPGQHAARAVADVAAFDPDRLDVDHHPVRRTGRVGHVLVAEHLGSTGLVVDGCFHAAIVLHAAAVVAGRPCPAPSQRARPDRGAVARAPRHANCVDPRRCRPLLHGPARSRRSCVRSTSASGRSPRAGWRRTSPSSRGPTRAGSASAWPPPTGTSTRWATRASPFTIQSISKPFVYGLALEDRGKPAVLARVGVEPTGDAFNEISLESGTGRPRNPMINAGAITADLAGCRPLARGPLGTHAVALLALRRAGALARRDRVPLGARHRAPQPRDQPHAAQLRDHRARSGAGSRPVLPAVLDRGHLPRPQHHRRHARDRRHQPGDARARAARVARATRCSP